MPPKFSRELKEKPIFPEYVADQARTSPCEADCPAGNPIQKINTLVQESRIEDALGYLKSRNPFPGITGRVCSHPCENVCNRNEFDEGVGIQALERFVADHADATLTKRHLKKGQTGKKLAIIGSGPAGMTCAYFSALFGHDVTVYEASSVLGGIPRMAIPDFWLPKDIVDREIGSVLDLGVRVLTNTLVGRDIAFENLMAENDACLIAVGTQKDRCLDIPGVEHALPAIPFLKGVNQGERNAIGDRVVVMGGGGVAFDCAFTAKRLGAEEVHIVCVEGLDCMCAPSHEIRQADAQGIIIHTSTAISGIQEDGGKTSGIECFEIASFEFDEASCLSVEPVSGEKRVLPADTVISAVGVETDLSFMGSQSQIELSPGGTLKVDPNSMATSVEGVFAAGDAAFGPSSVAQAIGNGRRAAVAIDCFFNDKRSQEPKRLIINTEGRIEAQDFISPSGPHVVAYEEIWNLSHHKRKPRQTTSRLSAEVAERSFAEVEKGFEKDAALIEAERCLHCGHCTSCGCCVEDCPGLILEMKSAGPQVAYPDECWHCGCCRIACPSGAVFYEFPLNMLV